MPSAPRITQDDKSSAESLGKYGRKSPSFISDDERPGIRYFTTSISLLKLSTTSYLTFSGA